MTILDRILLLMTGLLAAYQIAVGIDGVSNPPLMAYTIAFGVLLVAGLLLIVLGFDVLDSPLVVIVSTVIPLSLSLGLVWEHFATYRTPYLIFVIVGFLAVLTTRLLPQRQSLPVLVLAVVHGIAGLTIVLLPILLSITGQARPGFSLVGVGGALIGVGGLLLALLKAGKPLLSRGTILKILPGLLLLMTAAFVAGFALE
jgi:predicted neutral ceramidase superfamily lipid hydrolase